VVIDIDIRYYYRNYNYYRLRSLYPYCWLIITACIIRTRWFDILCDIIIDITVIISMQYTP
jgi:hypothetical protein